MPLEEGFTAVTARLILVWTALRWRRWRKNRGSIRSPEEEEDDNAGAANWFDQAAAEMANVTSLEFPEGYYSINDTVDDILKNKDASNILSNSISAMTGMKIKAVCLKW
ncbi:MAG: hypothetical protein ACLRMZ_13380 [Blautia marasmi]